MGREGGEGRVGRHVDEYKGRGGGEEKGEIEVDKGGREDQGKIGRKRRLSKELLCEGGEGREG